MSWSSWLMAAVFGVAVAVQLNDPDPLLWVVLYGIAGALSVAAAMGHNLPRVALAAAIVYGAGVALTFPAVIDSDMSAYTSFKMRSQGDEVARECVGLVLCTAWMVVLWRRGRTPSPHDS